MFPLSFISILAMVVLAGSPTEDGYCTAAPASNHLTRPPLPTARDPAVERPTVIHFCLPRNATLLLFYKAAGAASGSQEVRFLNTLSLRPGVPVTRRAVEAELELSLSRMGVERLDLVQLCW